MQPVDQAVEILGHLVALTPEPPTGGDAALVIEEGQRMLEQRAAGVSHLKLLLDANAGLLMGNTGARAKRDELAMLDRRWTDALLWAKSELAKQRLAGQRARQAQRAYHAA